MMRILYDHQIFALQRFGGISRTFIELMKRLPMEPNCRISWYRGFHVDDHPALGFIKKLEAHWSFPGKGRWLHEHTRRLNRLGLKSFSLLHGAFDIYHPTYYCQKTASRVRAKKLAITICDMIPEIYFRNIERFHSLLHDKKELIRRADLVFVISENTRNDLLRFFPVDPARIIRTYLASELSEIEAAPLPPVCLEKPFFLYVGTRSKYKNFKVLMEAFALQPRLKNDFNVVCFGGTGGFLEAEIDFMKKNGMAENFIYLNGADALLKALYLNAGALVYTSHYEGFGLPLLEAMECGCPAICCRHSSIPEVVGENAIFYDPHDPGQLADSLYKAVEDRSLRESLIQNGLMRARLFSWEKTAQETLRGYRAIL